MRASRMSGYRIFSLDSNQIKLVLSTMSLINMTTAQVDMTTTGRVLKRIDLFTTFCGNSLTVPMTSNYLINTTQKCFSTLEYWKSASPDLYDNRWMNIPRLLFTKELSNSCSKESVANICRQLNKSEST